MILRNSFKMYSYQVAQLLIENAEGFSPTWYNDTTGNKTIGYGFKYNGYAKEALKPYLTSPNKTMTMRAARKILDDIITGIISALMQDVPCFTSLSINKKAVLVDMAYNLGLEQLLTFDTFFPYLEQGKIDEAVCDLTQTLWYNQVKNRAVRDCLNLYAKDTNFYLL